MRALALAGDTWHPPAVVQDRLNGLGDVGLRFDYLEHTGSESAVRLADYDAAILRLSLDWVAGSAAARQARACR